MQRLIPIAFFLTVACSSYTVYVRQESDTLYFGTAKPDGSVVSVADWQQFLRDTVTPRFAGFTHWEAHGSWKGTEEETHVLVIVHPPGHEGAIQHIIDEYKKRFAQESVLRVRTDVWLVRATLSQSKTASPPPSRTAPRLATPSAAR
jgi:hypothetical protein